MWKIKIKIGFYLGTQNNYWVFSSTCRVLKYMICWLVPACTNVAARTEWSKLLIGSAVLTFMLFVGLVHLRLIPLGGRYFRIWQYVLVCIHRWNTWISLGNQRVDTDSVHHFNSLYWTSVKVDFDTTDTVKLFKGRFCCTEQEVWVVKTQNYRGLTDYL